MSDVPAIINWMQNSDIGTGIRESIWTFPIVETSHVLGLALSTGLLIWFDFRLLGWGMKHQPISQVHKQVMPYAAIGFIIMFVTGVLLFWSEAEKCYLSGFFRAKVLFLFLGVKCGRHCYDSFFNHFLRLFLLDQNRFIVLRVAAKMIGQIVRHCFYF